MATQKEEIQNHHEAVVKVMRRALAEQIWLAALKAYDDCDCPIDWIQQCPHVQPAIERVLAEQDGK